MSTLPRVIMRLSRPSGLRALPQQAGGSHWWISLRKACQSSLIYNPHRAISVFEDLTSSGKDHYGSVIDMLVRLPDSPVKPMRAVRWWVSCPHFPSNFSRDQLVWCTCMRFHVHDLSVSPMRVSVTVRLLSCQSQRLSKQLARLRCGHWTSVGQLM